MGGRGWFVLLSSFFTYLREDVVDVDLGGELHIGLFRVGALVPLEGPGGVGGWLGEFLWIGWMG